METYQAVLILIGVFIFILLILYYVSVIIKIGANDTAFKVGSYVFVAALLIAAVPFGLAYSGFLFIIGAFVIVFSKKRWSIKVASIILPILTAFIVSGLSYIAYLIV